MNEDHLRFKPLRERVVTLVKPEDLPPLPTKPPPMTPEERAVWRGRVRAAFAEVEADPDYVYGLTPPISMLDDPYPAMEFVVWGYEKATGRKLLFTLEADNA